MPSLFRYNGGVKNAYDQETTLDLKIMIIIARMVKAIDRFIAPSINAQGLTHTQFSVMEALYHKGPLTINEIIEKTLSSSGNVCVVITNLERSGLVSKVVSDKDKRSRRVELTERGRRIITDFFPIHVQQVQTMLSGLSLSEKVHLAEQMKKLSASIAKQKI